jgi:prevent-host-death family protein
MTTVRIPVAEARKGFAAVMARSAGGLRIKVTRYGRTLAALIPKRDLEKLENCEKKADKLATSGR